MPKKEKNNPKKKKAKYIVDYDITKRGRGRAQFYRKLKALGVEKSTDSVVLTSDPEKARLIHEAASGLGRSHKYRVVKKKKLTKK